MTGVLKIKFLGLNIGVNVGSIMQMDNYPCENGPLGIMVVIFIAPNSLMKTTFIMIVCTLRGN